ncbi:MAG: hypothetical protein P8Q92_06375 [Pseudoprimorskyibacter sp.]|nr:hypothetical protein [Pseudoprimorskyibacter sp.]
MRRNGWHILSDDARYTLTRHMPPRFDIAAEAWFPPCRPERLARQIRQDLWRTLKQLRGFSPVVEITTTAYGLNVRVGGRLSAQQTPKTALISIQQLINDPAWRNRWIRWAALTPQDPT